MYSVKKQTIHSKYEALFQESPILLFYHAPALTVKKWQTLKRDLVSAFSEKRLPFSPKPIPSLLLKRKVASLVFVNILKEDPTLFDSTERKGTPSTFQTPTFFQGPTLCFAVSSLAEMKRLHRVILQSEARQSLLLGCFYQKILFHTLETERLLSLDEETSCHFVNSLSTPVLNFVSLLQQKQHKSLSVLTLLQLQFLKTLKTLEQKKHLSGD